ncbi:hypothetical protein AcW2_007182 [Taiwanofungus camphoratus]|nr:hypothetical protein AcW2_007182 [Antrodia cinnamomea]
MSANSHTGLDTAFQELEVNKVELSIHQEASRMHGSELSNSQAEVGAVKENLHAHHTSSSQASIIEAVTTEASHISSTEIEGIVEAIRAQCEDLKVTGVEASRKADEKIDELRALIAHQAETLSAGLEESKGSSSKLVDLEIALLQAKVRTNDLSDEVKILRSQLNEARYDMRVGAMNADYDHVLQESIVRAQEALLKVIEDFDQFKNDAKVTAEESLNKETRYRSEVEDPKHKHEDLLLEAVAQAKTEAAVTHMHALRTVRAESQAIIDALRTELATVRGDHVILTEKVNTAKDIWRTIASTYARQREAENGWVHDTTCPYFVHGPRMTSAEAKVAQGQMQGQNLFNISYLHFSSYAYYAQSTPSSPAALSSANFSRSTIGLHVQYAGHARLSLTCSPHENTFQRLSFSLLLPTASCNTQSNHIDGFGFGPCGTVATRQHQCIDQCS